MSRSAYRRTRQNVALAFTFNGIGIPLAATGLVYPVWAMVASVTTISINSIGGSTLAAVRRDRQGRAPARRRSIQVHTTA